MVIFEIKELYFLKKRLFIFKNLQGEIPERSMFRQPIYRICLAPYLELTKAVRLGDTVIFNKVIEKYSAAFEADETMTLIVRLRQNVIKTALKQVTFRVQIFWRKMILNLRIINFSES